MDLCPSRLLFLLLLSALPKPFAPGPIQRRGGSLTGSTEPTPPKLPETSTAATSPSLHPHLLVDTQGHGVYGYGVWVYISEEREHPGHPNHAKLLIRPTKSPLKESEKPDPERSFSQEVFAFDVRVAKRNLSLWQKIKKDVWAYQRVHTEKKSLHFYYTVFEPRHSFQSYLNLVAGHPGVPETRASLFHAMAYVGYVPQDRVSDLQRVLTEFASGATYTERLKGFWYAGGGCFEFVKDALVRLSKDAGMRTNGFSSVEDAVGKVNEYLWKWRKKFCGRLNNSMY